MDNLGIVRGEPGKQGSISLSGTSSSLTELSSSYSFIINIMSFVHNLIPREVIMSFVGNMYVLEVLKREMNPNNTYLPHTCFFLIVQRELR